MLNAMLKYLKVETTDLQIKGLPSQSKQTIQVIDLVQIYRQYSNNSTIFSQNHVFCNWKLEHPFYGTPKITFYKPTVVRDGNRCQC